MIEFQIALNAIKLALSPQARRSVKALHEFISKSPEWQKDICTLDASIDTNERERAILLRDVIRLKLIDIGYPSECYESFSTAFAEIHANAVSHGFKYDSKKKRPVRLAFEVTPSYVVARVFNPHATEIDLPGWLDEARERLAIEPFSAGGRGLLLVDELADEFSGEEDSGVKVVFYRDRVDLEVVKHGSITVIRVKAGHKNPSLARRLIDRISELKPKKLIVDLSGQNPPSAKNRESASDASDIGWTLYESSRHHSGTTTAIGLMIPYFAQKELLWRIVCPNAALRALLPRPIVHPDMESALQYLSEREEA